MHRASLRCLIGLFLITIYCVSGDTNTVLESDVRANRLNSTINTLRSPRTSCGLESVLLPDVHLSHLIVGPGAMDLKLQRTKIQNLGDFRVTSLIERKTRAKSKIVDEITSLSFRILHDRTLVSPFKAHTDNCLNFHPVHQMNQPLYWSNFCSRA